jgi:alkaline phosphatase
MASNRILYILTACGLAVGLMAVVTRELAAFTPATAVAQITPDPLQELIPGQNYVTWFTANTANADTPHSIYFGAYKLEAVGDQLYLGYGSGLPADRNGSLLAVTNGSVLTAVAELDEQGFIDMEAVDGTLTIPGVDPTYGDGWDLGNFYFYTPGQPITKQRTLPNVMHAWGSWFDTNTDVLYTAVSSHLGDNATWTGEIFSTTTQGATWNRVGNHEDGLGDYRTYDIIGFNNKLYAIWNDAYGAAGSQCGLTTSADNGVTWTRITTQPLACRNRLHIWNNTLLTLSYDQKSFVAVDSANTITTHPLSGYRIPAWSYNYLANDADGYLYALAEYGQLVRTNNLTDWELMAHTGLELVTMAYWPHHNALVIGERGNGRLWTLDLTTAQPILPTAPTAKYIILLVADGWGAKQIEAAVNYSGSTPTYQTWPTYWVSTYAAGGSYDPAQAWSNFNYLLTNPTDSAAAATALFTGQKTANGRVSVNSSATDRLVTLSERAQQMGHASGAVSTVQISHATPGAWMAHNDARGNGYAIADEGLWGDPNTTGNPGISTYYNGGHGPTQPLDVLIGGGHPTWQSSAYVNAAIRDKLATENGQPGEFVFVERLAGSNDGGARLLTAANLNTTTRLAGLFGSTDGNLEYRLADNSGHDPENPTLAEMTTAALTVLQRNPKGFVLLVEGGAVDWASHNNNMDWMVGEMLGFNQAVQSVVDWVNDPGNGSTWANTLVIVTGDHETGYLTAAPGVFPDIPLGTVNATTLALEKVVSGTSRRASWDDANANSIMDENETIYWAWNAAGHTNSLIPLYAWGAGAPQLAGYATGSDPVRGAYLDNTAVFRVLDGALRTYRLPKPITTGKNYTVGDLSISFNPGGLGDVAYLEVISYTQSHPQATTLNLQTGRYWHIAAQNSLGQPAIGFSANMTITVGFTPTAEDKLCRYTGTGWQCGQTTDHTYNGNQITRHGIHQFSDWTVGQEVGPTAVTLSQLQMSQTSYTFGVIILALGFITAGIAWSGRKKS